MSEKILDQVMEVVDNIPEDFLYDTLKTRLLETRTLSDQSWRSFTCLCLWMAGMLAYCPAGMEQTIMFQFLFLQRLPVTPWMLLGEQETDDIRSLEDRLWATLTSHSPMISWPMWIKQRFRLCSPEKGASTEEEVCWENNLVGGCRPPLVASRRWLLVLALVQVG
jgi:hypothetical protein